MTRKYKKMLIIIASIIFGGLYYLSLNGVYSEYFSIKYSDPLAMIHSLFPFCYIVIVLFAMLCFTCVIYDIENRYIHIFLLIQFALMIWFTPYYLSGFSRETDSLWHVGVSKQVPLIEAGHDVMFSNYYNNYPSSYIFNYIFLEISRIDIYIYAQLIYPFFCCVSMILLLYVFVCRFFNCKIALISTLIMVLGCTPEIHISPHSLGTLLTLTSIIFIFTFRRRKTQLIGYFLLFILITVHSISPLIFLIFMIAPHILKVFIRNDLELSQSRTGILATIIMWLSWIVFNANWVEIKIARSIFNIITLNFFMQLETMARKASHTGVYLFPKIALLSKIVSYTYIFIPLMFFFLSIIDLDIKKGIKKLFIQIGMRIHPKQLLMLSIAFLCITLSVASVLSGVEVKERAFYLWERGFFYYVLTVSIYIGSNVPIKNVARARNNLTYTKVFTIFWLIFLVILYPIIHSELESYLSYPPSEGAGMNFLQSHAQLNGKTISMYLTGQLASYIDPETHFDYDTNHIQLLSNFLLYNKTDRPDSIVFRRTEYFQISQSYDKSFQKNRYTQALNRVELSHEYNKLYSNPTFDIYSRASA